MLEQIQFEIVVFDGISQCLDRLTVSGVVCLGSGDIRIAQYFEGEECHEKGQRVLSSHNSFTLALL